MASSAAFSQCENSVKISKTYIDKDSNTGSIEVEVSTTKEFVCTLSIQKGSGPEQVATKRGRGSDVVLFQNLDKNKIYQVEIEFTTDEKSVCKKLQKSLITFQ